MIENYINLNSVSIKRNPYVNIYFLYIAARASIVSTNHFHPKYIIYFIYKKKHHKNKQYCFFLYNILWYCISFFFFIYFYVIIWQIFLDFPFFFYNINIYFYTLLVFVLYVFFFVWFYIKNSILHIATLFTVH